LDSQSFASIDGEVSGMHDFTIFGDYLHGDGEASGKIPYYRQFAEYFYPNDIIYQVGYRPDLMWYASLEDPVIKSFGLKLAEATPLDQKMGIAWVDFALKLPNTFPDVLSDAQMASGANLLLGFLQNSGNNWLGRRLHHAEGYNAPTLTDALYVGRIRQIINNLTANQKEELFKINGIQSRLDMLAALEPEALDIRIANLPPASELRKKDAVEINTLKAIYNGFTDAQKAAVTKSKQLIDAETMVNN
jgi:hypothetical protein